MPFNLSRDKFVELYRKIKACWGHRVGEINIWKISEGLYLKLSNSVLLVTLKISRMQFQTLLDFESKRVERGL